jgi:hypothetical protein
VRNYGLAVRVAMWASFGWFSVVVTTGTDLLLEGYVQYFIVPSGLSTSCFDPPGRTGSQGIVVHR